ncbi:DUF4202 domain-containing protein [Carboxylicivirga caseinilyticus]|uniref:DUF4202 domain-containing protein n=1 Tax=Carboxylicivirga caseinilyticus TaxID=3417572 RepID=UPI003D356C95|nr:DUF4202 domain-containing protein [Marinilabiliaceae bacterium A049]
MKLSQHYMAAIELIDQAYQTEPNIEIYDGKSYPREYLYAQRMVTELMTFQPNASETELIAARCQHLNRWDIPRTDYPNGRKGYHDWRTTLYDYQAQKAADIMQKVGYDQQSIDEVKAMVGKVHIKLNNQTQLIEDVACLVFLEYYIQPFVDKHKEDEIKLVRIIHRTWGKMSDKGHAAALQLNIPKPILALIMKALERKES